MTLIRQQYRFGLGAINPMTGVADIDLFTLIC